MSQSPITITYSLEEVLTRLEGKIDKQFEVVNQRIDKLDEKVDHLTIEVTALTTKVVTIDRRLEKVEGIQKIKSVHS